MLSKKIVRFLKSGCLIISIGFLMEISGCKGNTEEPVASESVEIVDERKIDDNFINIPIDIYVEAAKNNELTDMETVCKVIKRFGECGYAAVDCENRVDMTQMQSVMDFCDSVENQKEAEVTIIQVSSLGGFSVYHLQTENGVVHVKRCYYGYKDGIMKSEDEGEYQTDYWRYTDDGYLMFSGTYFSEELYVLTLSSAEEHVAFRILPLDAKCRELNEKYLLPIGYELNNMFLVDWNEDDFGDLNFYDMFDLLYPKLHNEKFPYVADDNLGIGAVYHIPKTEFENVRRTCPLIHNITNYVTVNDCANMVLACGASPIMADDAAEVEDITTICGGLNINIGTLNSRTITSMLLAGKKANQLGHPVVLDPVGAGASRLRTDTAFRLLRDVKFTVIRGNISEIKTLASGAGTTKGVDADVADKVTEENLDSAVAFAKAFAAQTGAVIAITGAIDIVADAEKAYCIRNGNAMMSSITGTGCQLSALTAAFVTANPGHPLEAAAAAVCAMGLAGETAHKRLTPLDGNSTYRNYIIDAIYNMTPDQLEEGANYEVR